MSELRKPPQNSLQDAMLAALLVAEKWMVSTIKTCKAENASTFLPRGYPAHLKTVRRAIAIAKSAKP